MFKHKIYTLIVAVWMIPNGVLAASIVADDTVAGLGTDVDISNLDPHTEVTVVITPPFGSEVVADVHTDSTGYAHVSIPGNETEVAGIHGVSLEQSGMQLGVETMFEVLADSAHGASSSISSNTHTIRPDGLDSAEVVVILRDRFGNPLVGRPIKLISSRGSDSIIAMQNETDEYGEQRFTVQTREAGSLSLRAMDFISGEILSTEFVLHAQAGSTELAMGGDTHRTFYPSADTSPTPSPLYGSVLRAEVGYGDVDHFVISAPRNLQINEDATIRITAVDANGNRVEDYIGTVLLSSTDPSAFLPIGGKVPFRAQDLGEKQLTLGLRFRTAGEHILHAEDSKNPGIVTETTINVTGGSDSSSTTKLIRITEPADNELTSETTVTISGNTEPYVNLLVSGGLYAIEGETDVSGDFSIEVDLDPEESRHTLRVRDESGVLDSGEIVVRLDNKAPNIRKINLTPDRPVEGTDVLFVLEVDPDVTELKVNLNNEPLEMDKAPGVKGKFQSLFKAPPAGRHEISITIADKAQNSLTQVASFHSGLKGLPKVTGLKASNVKELVELEWSPVAAEEEIDAYRVYVGESPTEFEISMDTEQATTVTQIDGLEPGKEYYFAVTALKGNRESEDKSDTVKATVFGIRLDIQSQANGLMLDWSNMETSIPLSSFILEYGVEPDKYTEKRILNGELRNFTVRDLLNEVTYFMKLTPVSITGEMVEDLIATTDGKPVKIAGGFRPSPAEPVPFDIISQATAKVTPPPNLHASAPETPPTGLPSFMWWLLVSVAGGAFIVQWKRKRTLQQTVAFLQTMENRYHL